MPIYKSLEELRRALKKDLEARERATKKAVRRAAVRGAALMRRNVPVAFSELRDSIHVVGYRIVADAPHAAAVNDGSRPHMPPIAPIVKWVRLRGAQGLANESSLKRLTGTTTHAAARGVAGLLRQHEFEGFGKQLGNDGASPSDAPTRVAWAIAMAIAKRGTKPHHYLEKTAPHIYAILDEEMAVAMRAPTGT